MNISYYLNIKRKKGDRKTIIAVALLVYAYWMLKRNETYEELSLWVNSWDKSQSIEQGRRFITGEKENRAIPEQMNNDLFRMVMIKD